MLNFDTEIDTARSSQAVVTTAPVVTETIKVTPTPMSEARAFVAKADSAWEWDDLRDYVVHQIEQRFGPWPRDSFKEAGTFKRFLAEWGTDAPRIARHAFEVCDGWWSSAPISINRFTRGSDPFFAQVIADRLP